MKKINILLAAAAFVGFATSANAQGLGATDEASATAYAKIISPITIEFQEHLEFGSMIANDGGVVRVGTSNARTLVSGNVTLIGNIGATPNAAQFIVTGETDYTFNIELPSSIEISNGTETMEVDNFQASVSTASTAIDAGGTTFTVGADLHVDEDQANGDYELEFDVTVNYN